MTKENAIKLFNERRIRTQWDDSREKWYFSIVDVIGVLTESENPNNYWKVLKSRLRKEGSELVTNCNQLKMQSSMINIKKQIIQFLVLEMKPLQIVTL